MERLEQRVALAGDAFVGALMRTTAAVDVRTQPTLTAAELPANTGQYPFYTGAAPAGQLGAVIEGPRTQDARTWWRVDFGPGKYAGWVTEEVLTATTIAYVRGIDVSHWQAQINWPSVKNFGIQFAFMKATESTDFVDPRFQQNVTGSRNAGVLVGFYHFANILQTGDIAADARAEAAHFVNIAGPHIRAPGLPPVLDLEGRGLDGQPPNKAAISAWARAWLTEVQRLTGVRPMIYVNSDWAKNYLETDLRQYNLWHARWTRDLDQPPLPTDPGIWAPNWTFWQYTSNSRVPGIAAGAPGVMTDVDGDVFKGTLADLQTWALAAVPDRIPPAVSGVSVGPTPVTAGQPVTVRWTATDHVAVDHIGLYLYNNDMPVDTRPYVSGGTISGQLNASAGNLQNTGSYSWTVPLTLPVGTYQVKVIAWDAAGNNASNGANLFSNVFVVNSPPLTAVSDLVASATATNEISLTWTDTIVAEDGFYVERSSDGVTYDRIATIGIGSTAFNDHMLQSSLQYSYRIRAFREREQGPASNPANATTPQLTAITGTSAADTYHVVRSGTLLQVYENTAPVGQPTYSSELAAMTGTLSIDGGGGDDSLTVNAGEQPSLGLTRLNYSAGAGANSLVLEQGTARIDSRTAGGTLDSTIQDGAALTTNRLNQDGLTISGNGRVTLLADGQTSVLTTLDLSPTATLDLADNDLVIQSTAVAKPALLSTIYGRVAAGYAGGLWNAAGITSANAAANPNMNTGLAVVDNALLSLTEFGGIAVDENSILLKYTYYGDIDVNGQVDVDDLTVFANNFGRTTGATQIDGDIDFDGDVDADDLTVFANTFGRGIGAPLADSGPDFISIPLDTQLPNATRRGSTFAIALAKSTARDDLEAPNEKSGPHFNSAADIGGQEGLLDLLAHAVASGFTAHTDALADPRLAVTRLPENLDALWGSGR